MAIEGEYREKLWGNVRRKKQHEMVSTLWTQFLNTEIWIKLFEYIKTNLINSKTLVEKNSCVQVVAGRIFHGLMLE